MDRSKALERTRAWVEEVVLAHRLCPFAAEPYRAGRVQFAASKADDFDEAIASVLDEVETIVDELLVAEESGEPGVVSTVLCVFPGALADFGEFVDACATLEALFEEAGVDGLLQLAHFHPDYRFEGSEEDDPANYTNRSPHPIIQLLRVDELAERIDGHPDPEGIPDRNIETMRELGLEAVRSKLEELSPRPRAESS